MRKREAAEDVLQNTALKCLTKPPHRCPDNPRCYVAQMVRNASIDYLRKSRRELPTDFQDEAQDLLVGSTPLCGRVHLEHKQTLQVVARTLGTLPERNQQIFLRHRMSEARQKDIADAFDLSPARVNGVVKQVQDICRATAFQGEQ
ncbi:sigma-70 family RNA polymerase sigma factor [Arenibacterium sp. LLYu02]|uniref:sigma-70 family RNA polymerase sigma factor n=1 Tax=Arenibacterium sp. LLYu02 TaxID=3404132 RepID=UPI003B21D9E8